MAKTPEQFAAAIRSLGKCIDRNAIEIPALKLLEGLMKTRVFNNGLAADGTKIGVYVSDWKQKRQERGRQTGYVDLSFEGDLFRSIQTGKSGRANVLGFTTTAQKIIGRSNEAYRGKKIFALSEEEKKAVINSIKNGVNAELKKCLGK